MDKYTNLHVGGHTVDIKISDLIPTYFEAILNIAKTY